LAIEHGHRFAPLVGREVRRRAANVATEGVAQQVRGSVIARGSAGLHEACGK